MLFRVAWKQEKERERERESLVNTWRSAIYGSLFFKMVFRSSGYQAGSEMNDGNVLVWTNWIELYFAVIIPSFNN